MIVKLKTNSRSNTGKRATEHHMFWHTYPVVIMILLLWI